MGYRKIVINEEEYTWTVGRVYAKVRYPDGSSHFFKNELIGSPCEGDFIVGPRQIRHAVLGLGLPIFGPCRHSTITSKLVWDPYSSEIFGRSLPMLACDQCQSESAADI